VNFALHSARRESEICRLEWRDNDAASRSGLVRDAKHPAHREGNHRRFKYTREAVLGIEDLRFHDLRHEATSRLFERGYQIHEVAQFTLHESWNELKRYANLKPENIRDLDAPFVNGATHIRVQPLIASGPSHAARRSARRGRPRSQATGISDRRA
jgi:integrase